MLAGEPPEEAAAREMLEETGLRVSGARFNGILNFYLGDSKELDQTVFVFFCENSTGKMRASKEGELRWFSVDAIPYSEMWQDDQVWLPLMLEGKSLVGDFYFTKDYKEFLRNEIHQTSFARIVGSHARQRRTGFIE